MTTNVVSPVPKKSTDLMVDYVRYFERLALANDWNDEKRAVVFPSLLEVGSKALDGFSDSTLSSFVAIKKALLGEAEPFRESNCSKLLKVSRATDESLNLYRERIAGLVEKVYPKFAAANKQCLIRDFFVHSLPTDYQKFLMGTNSGKIEDALNAALLFESMCAPVCLQKNHRKWTSQSKDSSDVGKQYTKTIICHFCSKPGHISRNCFKKQNSEKKPVSEEKSGFSRALHELSGVKFVTLQIGDRVERLLVDTGAAISVLPSAYFDASDKRQITLKLADESVLVSNGCNTFPVKMLDGTLIAKHEFCIANVKKCYLGYDLLKKMNAVIHIHNEYIVGADGEWRIPLERPEDDVSFDTPVMVLADINFDDVEFLTDDVPEIIRPTSHVGDDATLERVDELLESFDDLFHGIGKTDLVVHHIETTDDVPVNLPSYRIPLHLKNKARDVISELLENDIICKSNSDYCSPVILVKKPNSDAVRVTIDYRVLNAKSKKDSFASPRLDDLIDKLYGATVFSKLDLRAAYHNILVAPEDREKTAFRFDGELYHYNRVPFGLSAAPGTFLRLIEKVLCKMRDFTSGYFDDITIFSRSLDEHFEHVRIVLDALREAGLKLNRSKCVFCVNTIDFLGFRISPNTVTVSGKKIETITKYPVPRTIRDVKKLLGLVGFYRKLIPNFSVLTAPLCVMQCKNADFRWTDDCQTAFDTLISLLASSPIVTIPNPDLTFIVKVDSSKFGVGCILEQEDPVSRQRFVIEYGSVKYNKAQQNYPAIELEVCGLIFAIKHWRCYLIGKPFIVETDSKAVQWIQGKRDMLGKLGRWSLYLENFDFTTRHIAGKDHLGPDALSRIHEVDIKTIDCVNLLSNLSAWKNEIDADTELCDLSYRNIIALKNDVYVRSDDLKNIIVVPKSMREDIVKHLHADFGHPGIKKTAARIRERFFWPGLSKFVKTFCKKCHLCAINKDNPAPNSAPLLPISTIGLVPFDKVAIDILGPFPTAVDGSNYLVVLQDYFTKWPEAIALKTVESDAIQNWLLSDVIPRYGVFNELVTDQGVQFISRSFQDFCKNLGIKHKTTSPFHPQTDGMVEKFNRTFLNMVRNYVSENQTDWSSHVPLLLYSYRTAVHDSIGVSPAEALQVRKLNLPLDVIRPPGLTFNGESRNKTFDDFLDKMSLIRSKIRLDAERALQNRKKCYDSAKTRKIRESFNVGDKVYWKKPIAKIGRSPKLSPIWQGPFVIKSKQSELNYIITDDKNTIVTVHVNNLKKCHDVNTNVKIIGKRGRPKK